MKAAEARTEDESIHSTQMAALAEERNGLAQRLSDAEKQIQEHHSLRLTLDEAERMLKDSDFALAAARQTHADAVTRAEEAERQLEDSLRCLSEEQQKHRLVLDERDDLVDQMSRANAVHTERDSLLEQVSNLQQELSQVEAVVAMCRQYQVSVFAIFLIFKTFY